MSVITFTLSNDIRTNATDLATGTHSIAVATAAVTTSENIYSELLVNNFTVDATDKAAPTVTTVEYQSATKIVITFSEGLDASTFATGKNGFSVTGGTLTSAALVDGANNQLTLTGTNFTKNTNVYYNSIFGITDLLDNKLADIAHTDVLDVE
jgi:hypothetical protein